MAAVCAGICGWSRISVCSNIGAVGPWSVGMGDRRGEAELNFKAVRTDSVVAGEGSVAIAGVAARSCGRDVPL